MQYTVAALTLRGTSPYSQSRQHNDPKLEGESMDDYDARTWRSKLSVEEHNGKKTIVIPPHGFHQCLIAAAKYSKRQIPGQGKATWSAKFTSGIMIPAAPTLQIPPEDATMVTISANADGVRGSGKRVTRRFPVVREWSSTFEIIILDPIIVELVFKEMVELAGLFIGVGQFRPQNGGHNGRFVLDRLNWQDNRQMVA